ncbi:hypothetical protein [Micromonospora echinospora]|uniref:hypothetical protein n=1 Tax=Micromonospora echinospora TaxID=1877 RepID=UPI003A8C0540
MKCYVCGQQATVQVVVKTMTGETRYRACDTCEPRHIPQGDVVSIATTPLPTTR